MIYMYHKEHGAKLFKDLKEIKEAGDGWVDSPAKLGEEIVEDLKIKEEKHKKVKKEKE